MGGKTPTTATANASTSASPIVVPEGFTLHTENNSHILISSKDEAFLNPVQEFNRDLSVACIRVWSEEMNREKEEKWKKAEERRAKRLAEAVWKKPKSEGGHLYCRSITNVDGIAEGEGETSQSADPAEDVSMLDIVASPEGKPRVVRWYD
jgi:tRNA (guanine26-N2/guanine27-N2)-dimethyltransferase